MSTTTTQVENYLASISMTLADLADELSTVQFDVDSVNGYEPKGTILKALPTQTRFKPKSVWVSLGNGKYKHLTGEKGLIAKHSRLEGYTSVVFRP
jgi:orotate phosphoribosyltransferase-like protein